MGEKQRKNIAVGPLVGVVQRRDQPAERLTRRRVARLLTKSPDHPYGIKVVLESGIVGRVQYVIGEQEKS